MYSRVFKKNLNKLMDIKIWSFENTSADFRTHSSHKQWHRFKINCTKVQSLKSKLISKIFSHVITHGSFCMSWILGIFYESSCFQKCQNCIGYTFRILHPISFKSAIVSNIALILFGPCNMKIMKHIWITSRWKREYI